MTTIYKFEVLIPDYEKKGLHELTRSLFGGLYVSTVERKDVEFFDNRDTQQIDKLFSGWQPINTAPEKEYVLVWHPDYGVAEAIFDPEEVSIEGNVVNHVWVVFYCEDWWYTSILNPAPLYWQSLPKPPQL